MTTIETALIGLATAFIGTAVLSFKRRPTLAPTAALSLGLVFALVTVAFFVCAPEIGHRQSLLLGMSVIFGLQATYWIHWVRFARDGQASPLAVRRPPLFKTSFLAFFAAAPQMVVMAEPDPFWAVTDGIAIVMFGVGLYFSETSARQLRRFMAADGGDGSRVLDTGLWRLTRQPHFFGACLMATSFFVMGFASTNGAVTLFAPLLLMHYLRDALDVQGTEIAMLRDAPGYRDYAQVTPAFFPRLRSRKIS